jgi:hypothetical protein
MTNPRNARPSRTIARSVTPALLALGLLLGAPAAMADEFIDRLNALFADVRPDRRSDTVILAALAEMEPPPAVVRGQREAALYPPSGPAWRELADWASAPAQQAVLAALDSVTEEQDRRRAPVFAQPYGIDALGADPDQIPFIGAGLYTDLGEPPLIASAQHLYLEQFNDMSVLVHVEATRRLAEGDPAGAMDALADLVQFGRQMLDRPFHAEKRGAMRTMIVALERVRDVAYVARREGIALSPTDLRAVIARFRDRDGPMELQRVRLPRGDFIGAEQLIATVIEPRGRVRVDRFAQTMARVQSSDRPLRLFGESARWRDAAEMHADWFATNEVLNSLRSDYEFRWDRDPFDPLVSGPYVVQRLGSTPATAVTAALPDMRDLFVLRQVLRTELTGTRDALGLAAFHEVNGSYPLDLSGIRPTFVEQIGIDPFDPAVADGRSPPLRFFVPVRDTADRFRGRTVVPPHEISILVQYAPNASILLREDQFVLYSVGADGAAGWADEVQNSPDAPAGRDYLLWPPVLSVVRDTLVQAGRYD